MTNASAQQVIRIKKRMTLLLSEQRTKNNCWDEFIGSNTFLNTGDTDQDPVFCWAFFEEIFHDKPLIWEIDKLQVVVHSNNMDLFVIMDASKSISGDSFQREKTWAQQLFERIKRKYVRMNAAMVAQGPTDLNVCHCQPSCHPEELNSQCLMCQTKFLFFICQKYVQYKFLTCNRPSIKQPTKHPIKPRQNPNKHHTKVQSDINQSTNKSPNFEPNFVSNKSSIKAGEIFKVIRSVIIQFVMQKELDLGD
ncbi:hypothetical protein RFI_22381 [Reticulomyxa filosa]|uniref:VWFA domain-containing protein n=1 Tax=Reticulomyxa filosa TaxID=46433 RepID=X6MLV5_RETFI|nr:hypothetical protein RFI_22381 [Reticulomyxa filosa]|eukprot:ETO14988.1 hypothetical protein RFI_22381 [Reticulomyxa filosa]